VAQFLSIKISNVVFITFVPFNNFPLNFLTHKVFSISIDNSYIFIKSTSLHITTSTNMQMIVKRISIDTLCQIFISFSVINGKLFTIRYQMTSQPNKTQNRNVNNPLIPRIFRIISIQYTLRYLQGRKGIEEIYKKRINQPLATYGCLM
jgi:hypothetical protein